MIRDRIMHGIGTTEPFIEEIMESGLAGHPVITVTWRKPLRIDEVNQMADTVEVRERKGRP